MRCLLATRNLIRYDNDKRGSRLASPFAFQINFVPTNSLRSFAVQIIESMQVFRKFFVLFSLCFVFLFASCVSLRTSELSPEDEAVLYPLETYIPEVFDWQEIREESGEGIVSGAWRFDFENPDIPLIYHAVKIDLSSVWAERAGGAGLTLVTSQWERTCDFAKREKSLVAINATPYDKTKLAGIYKVDGKLLSQPVARYAALGLMCGAGGNVSGARIFSSQADTGLEDFEYAFGGFFTVLENGQVRQDFIRRSDSRSGAGLSADGKILYLLVVEGERASQSIGLSYPQCGAIFRAMGCSDALEFDGGGSAELCINGKSVLSYKVRRVNGNSFGVK